MKSGRAKIKGYNDDTNPSSDREESFHNDNEKSEEKKDMSSPLIDDTSTTTASKAKGGDLNVVKLDDNVANDEAAKGMCVNRYDV